VGFVYNNPMEAMCVTYLEMNGYFVISNLRPCVLESEQSQYGFEADLVAYRLPNTNLPHVDAPEREPENGQFYPPRDSRLPSLIYCEIKANIALGDDLQMVRNLLKSRDAIENVERKANILCERFSVSREQLSVVMMANRLGKNQKVAIRNLNWLFKEFMPMFDFIKARFRKYPAQKGRVQYNDPWLEMLRFLNRWQLAKEGAFPFSDDD
jgi:hypothetical protein